MLKLSGHSTRFQSQSVRHVLNVSICSKRQLDLNVAGRWHAYSTQICDLVLRWPSSPRSCHPLKECNFCLSTLNPITKSLDSCIAWQTGMRRLELADVTRIIPPNVFSHCQNAAVTLLPTRQGHRALLLLSLCSFLPRALSLCEPKVRRLRVP